MDIYGFGILLIEMANGSTPSADNALRALFSRAMGEVSWELNPPEKFSSDFKHFIGECIKFDPGARPTAEMLLQVCNIPFVWYSKAL